jgi:hypothetical protein
MSAQIDDSVEVKLRQERSGRPLCADIVEEVQGYPSFLPLEPWIRLEREVCRRRLVAAAAAGL